MNVSCNGYLVSFSPHLSVADFFLWGYLKKGVFCQPVRTIKELKARITTYIAQIAPTTLKNVFWNMIPHEVTYKNVDGTQFQHFPHNILHNKRFFLKFIFLGCVIKNTCYIYKKISVFSKFVPKFHKIHLKFHLT